MNGMVHSTRCITYNGIGVYVSSMTVCVGLGTMTVMYGTLKKGNCARCFMNGFWVTIKRFTIDNAIHIMGASIVFMLISCRCHKQ